MKKTLNIFIVLFCSAVLISLAFQLLSVNADFFKMLYNSWEGLNYTSKQTRIIGFSYAAATLLIMFGYQANNKFKTYFIRALFPLIDGFIIMVFFNVNISDFKPIMAITYGLYSALILIFVGATIKRIFIKFFYSDNKPVETLPNDYIKSLESEVKQLKEYNKRLENTIESERIDLDLYRDILRLGIAKKIQNLRMKKELSMYKDDITKLTENLPELQKLILKLNYNE